MPLRLAISSLRGDHTNNKSLLTKLISMEFQPARPSASDTLKHVVPIFMRRSIFLSSGRWPYVWRLESEVCYIPLNLCNKKQTSPVWILLLLCAYIGVGVEAVVRGRRCRRVRGLEESNSFRRIRWSVVALKTSRKKIKWTQTWPLSKLVAIILITVLERFFNQ